MVASLLTQESTNTRLPQPQTKESYLYLREEELGGYLSAPFFKNQLVWVLCSKGRRKNNDTLRKRLFSRARVLEDCPSSVDHRVHVQYPLGSTYHVRGNFVERVLNPEHYKDRLVVVVPETFDYRKLCVLHTLPDEDFLEIGSDLGKNVHRVHEAGDSRSSAGRRVIGIDKSDYSIAESRKNFPGLCFIEWDVMMKEKPNELEGCKFDVIAIDINGNRELPAVLECLDAVWNLHGWDPRLVIVKSRSLHALLVEKSAPAET